MGKILPIVNVALAAIAMIVSIIVLLQVIGIKTSLENPVDPEAEAEIAEEAVIPFSQLEEFNMKDSFILTPERLEKPDAKINVVLKMGFLIDTLDEGAEEARITLAGKSQIIGSRLQDVLNKKDVSYFEFEDDVKTNELKAELLILIQELIGNEAVTEVYFIKPIISEK